MQGNRKSNQQDTKVGFLLYVHNAHRIPQMLGEEMSDGSIRPMDSPRATGLEGLTGPQGTGREARMMYDPNRRPGSSGRRYFTDTQYIAEDEDIPAAEERMATQAAELSEANIRNPARQRRPQPQQMAAGGLAGHKKGKVFKRQQ